MKAAFCIQLPRSLSVLSVKLLYQAWGCYTQMHDGAREGPT